MNIDDINSYYEQGLTFDFSFIENTQVYVVAKNDDAGVLCTIPIKDFHVRGGKITGSMAGKIKEFDINQKHDITEDEFLEFIESGGANG